MRQSRAGRRLGVVALIASWLALGCNSKVEPGGTGGAGGQGGSGATTTTTGSTTTTTSTGAPECPPDCAAGLTCCDGQCVNLENDFNNCGACKQSCALNDTPFCNQGACADPPCDLVGISCKGDEVCCGEACCAEGELCCWLPSAGGAVLGCAAAENGTCPRQ